MLSPSEALEIILERAPALSTERVAVGPGLVGRVLAQPARAVVSLPPFATSSMDGYAVRAAELGDGPVPIAARIAAGDPPIPLAPGTAAGIATGAPVPDGADSIVPIEVTEERDGGLVAAPPVVGACIRRAGEDVSAGDVIAEAGAVLSPAALAALASAGVWELELARRPRVAAIATGSELVAAGEPLQPGQIYESNLTAVTAQSLRAGAEMTMAEVVRDDPQAISDALASALSADVVISSGGVSVGPHDYVKPALLGLGVEEVFWRVAHKPGKPLWFGVADSGALVFGVPGNPVSSLVCFELFIRPALMRMQGAATPPRAVARLARPVKRLRQRDHAMRCTLAPGPDGMQLDPQSAQESHLIAHAAHADAIAFIDHGDGEVAAGELVQYVLL